MCIWLWYTKKRLLLLWQCPVRCVLLRFCLQWQFLLFLSSCLRSRLEITFFKVLRCLKLYVFFFLFELREILLLISSTDGCAGEINWTIISAEDSVFFYVDEMSVLWPIEPPFCIVFWCLCLLCGLYVPFAICWSYLIHFCASGMYIFRIILKLLNLDKKQNALHRKTIARQSDFRSSESYIYNSMKVKLAYC